LLTLSREPGSEKAESGDTSGFEAADDPE